MRSLLLVICAVGIASGCAAPEERIYPVRPKDTPYYLNETSITEIDQSTRAVLRRARQETGIEFVMVLLRSIPDYIYVGDYAAGLFDEWRVGSKSDGEGILILFIEEDQTLKIEVSYELEPILTDAYCESFQPTVKSYYAGRYFGDVFDGIVGSLVRRVVLEITDEDDDAFARPVTDPDALRASQVFLSGGGGIIDDEYYYEPDAKLSFIRPISPDKIRQFDTDRDAMVVVDRYLASLREGINYPFLNMLTEGSQMMRLEYPESPHFYRERWKDCERGFPYEIVTEGDLAAVRFEEGGSFPIFLRRTSDGFWKIDAARAWVSSWQDFAGSRSGPMHRDHPWMFAFPEYEQGKSLCNVPDPVPLALSLRQEIGKLEKAIKENPESASNYFNLADVFYWDCMWIAAAIDLVERGLELDEANIPYRWLAIYMRYRFPSTEPNGRHFEILLSIDPGDPDVLYLYSFHCWHLTMKHKKAIRLLRRARAVEMSRQGSCPRYERYLDSYKEKYWKQLAVDRDALWALWNYLRIFHWP